HRRDARGAAVGREGGARRRARRRARPHGRRLPRILQAGLRDDPRRSRQVHRPGRLTMARRLWSRYGGYVLGFASLFLLWHLAAVYLVSSVLFPPPTVV